MMVMVVVDGMLCEAEFIKRNKAGNRVYVRIPFFYSQYAEQYHPKGKDEKCLWVDAENIM